MRNYTDGDKWYQAAYSEWLAIIKQLWIAIGKQVDGERLGVYAKSLETVPLGLLEVAIGNLLKSHEYANVPPVGEIWRAVNDELTLTKTFTVQAWVMAQGTGIYKFEPEDVVI